MSPSPTPAMQRERRCHPEPHLPRKRNVDVAKCNACHAKCRSATGDYPGPSAPPDPTQHQKCHACHAKEKWMSCVTKLCVCVRVVCDKVVCERFVCEKVVCVCEKVVCKSLYVTKLCVKDLCARKLCVCVRKLYVKDCM